MFTLNVDENLFWSVFGRHLSLIPHTSYQLLNSLNGLIYFGGISTRLASNYRKITTCPRFISSRQSFGQVRITRTWYIFLSKGQRSFILRHSHPNANRSAQKPKQTPFTFKHFISHVTNVETQFRRGFQQGLFNSFSFKFSFFHGYPQCPLSRLLS